MHPRMIRATVVLFIIISVFIMSFAILYEPISYICQSLIDISGSGISDEADDEIAAIPYIFISWIVFGILLVMYFYALYSQKTEYEQEEKSYG